ncbi:MAG TPA: amidohydrolase [Steroidobacteraceae bacterium]|nr:amidohydrolase [Steroidobacteraceae bacterium]
MRVSVRLLVGAVALCAGVTLAAGGGLRAEVDAVYPQMQALYRDLHEHPELSTLETETAAKLAARLKELGYDVTTGIGGTGLVGVLKNGVGPTVALRVELDALPVVENTGLPFASRVKTKDASGAEVGVMHACGHDAHMAAWVGTATVMAANRKRWRGTLVLVGQPAEEVGVGAKAMMAGGLLTRFPKPDFALAIHDDARRPAGEVGLASGPILTNADSLDVVVYGRGGHGARPEATIDPVLIASRIVVTLQSIVAREQDPLDPAVITVGSIHGGTKYNIIPDEVRLQLTVRSFNERTRSKLLAAIDRIAKAEAQAAGAEKLPTIKRTIVAEALSNDPALAARLRPALTRDLGADQVKDAKPEMVSEDFTEWPLAGVPSVMMRIGAVNRTKYDAAVKNDTPLPSLHSSQFAPDAEPTIKGAIAAEVSALRELLR